MRSIYVGVLGSVVLLTGCGMGVTSTSAPPAVPSISSVTPSATGTPNSVTALGSYEFVSEQTTGQIFTYDTSSGVPVAIGTPYAMPCTSPSGMVITHISGESVMAVACNDTGALVTLSVHGDGSLSALGTVNGLGVGQPYPGIALDGANVLVPLIGISGAANGGVVKVSLASPSAPVITGAVTLASPGPGEYENPGYLIVSNGEIYVEAGSENSPLASSSTIQVVDEATMQLVGSPLLVAHSPQQLAVQDNVLYVTLFDATQLETIDISNPSSLRVLETLPLNSPTLSCSAIPVVIDGTYAYVGCYSQGVIEVMDVSNPSSIRLVNTVTNIPDPERFNLVGNNLQVTSSSVGGAVFQISTALLR